MNEEEIRERLRKLREYAEQLGFTVEYISCDASSDYVYEIPEGIPRITRTYWKIYVTLSAPLKIEGEE